jgi:hypothetical protein
VGIACGGLGEWAEILEGEGARNFCGLASACLPFEAQGKQDAGATGSGNAAWPGLGLVLCIVIR